jgi:hypothetical protein
VRTSSAIIPRHLPTPDYQTQVEIIMKNHALHILSFSAVFGLAACGGGGDSSPSVPNPPDTGAPTLTPTAADPNTVITTATTTFDLRWGRQAAPALLATRVRQLNP